MEKPDICNVEKMKYEPLNNKDMKKLLGLITALYFGLASLNAMSYEEARDRARFLTDKMAYELNLNDQQYNDAYEINLDYLMNIRTAATLRACIWNTETLICALSSTTGSMLCFRLPLTFSDP